MNRRSEDLWSDLGVVVTRDPLLGGYPRVDQTPFDPDRAYPEYRGLVGNRPNPIYARVRHTLGLLGRDEVNRQTSAWNPLRGIVEPGMKVLVKPNWVVDCPPTAVDRDALFTHMSVVRALIDYVQIALHGQGVITLGDAPIQRADWDNLMEILGCAKTVAMLNERPDAVPIRVEDFRREVTVRDRLGMVTSRQLRSDAEGIEVDLGTGSALMPIIADYRRFRVTQYDPAGLLRSHNPHRNCYMVHRRPLDADVIINVPKLKTHRKTGLTGALKNMVGIARGKDWLPHHRVGDRESGAGDQYRSKSWLRRVYAALCDTIERGSLPRRRAACVLRKGLSGVLRLTVEGNSCEGNWYGNDTAWRMVHDLNLIACFASRDGQMTHGVRRRVFHFVDAIVAGEGEGPLHPVRRPVGVFIAGTNPIAMDTVAATLMGFDADKIPLLRGARSVAAGWRLPPGCFDKRDIRVVLDNAGLVERLDLRGLAARINLNFRPPAGWVGMVERGDAEVPRELFEPAEADKAYGDLHR